MPIIRTLCLIIFLGWIVSACSTTPTAPEDLASVDETTDYTAHTGAGIERPVQPQHTVSCPPARSQAMAAARPGRQVLLDEALDLCQTAQDFWQKGDQESALEALDKAYALILQADGENDPKLMQQKEDLRFTIAKRILEIHASRYIVVSGQHRAIPLVHNRHVDAEIEILTGPERGFFIAALQRSGRYRPQIQAALRQAGLPEPLSWLPLIESGFKVNALSPARALGLWQFIPSTGYKFGLNRDTYIDERLDPDKSTAAAVSYLTELHSIFGDWTTVLAAYNCGEGRVLRTIRSQNINYLDNFWDLYERLPAETARYVPRFLATLHIVQNLKHYGLGEVKIDAPLDFETVEISRQAALKDIAAAISTDEQSLRQLNPELRHRITPGDGYVLKVPPGRTQALLAVIDEIPQASRVAAAGSIDYRVRPGDTLSTIARRYRTSVSAIMRANRLRRSGHIVAGHTLKVPTWAGAGTTLAAAGSGRLNAGTSGVSRTVAHTVASGDSLWNLARRYGTTVQKIQAANKLSGTRLDIDQALVIPVHGQPAAPSSSKVYQVKKGDTPFMIANRYKMPLERLLRINRLTPRCTIYPGQRLHIE